MSKTRKKFDWEIYEGDECIDMLSMSRKEMKEYQKNHPEFIIREVGYTDDGENDSWETNSEKGRNIYSVRIPRR